MALLTTIPDGPLRMPPWMITDIARCADNTPYGRRVKADMAFMEITGLSSTTQSALWAPHVAKVDAAITRKDAAFRKQVLDHMRQNPAGSIDYETIMVDPVTRSFIEGHGNCVAGITLLSRMHDDVVLIGADDEEHDDGQIPVEIEGYAHRGKALNCLSLEIELAEDVRWTPGVLTLGSELPETIALLVPGMPLSKVVSHPLLDAHAMTIRTLHKGQILVDFADDAFTSAYA